MAIPDDRRSLLAAMQTNYLHLTHQLKSVPAERARSACVAGHMQGSLISAADLVAYLIGWGQLVLKWEAAWQTGEAVDFPETGYRWNNLGALARKFYRDGEGLPWPALLERLAETHAALVALVERHDDRTLYGAPWYGKHTLGRMVQLNTAAPYANARARLRKAFGPAVARTSGTVQP
ncbi:ClbS/DfsB family four-helix bundle protein [Gulbenkiania mobilis]|uniref:ClbS/DfsB family four-helix bundle protein n=1 Tax=Gulbenkiania mobilis TaxID=397457 RepID=UPI0006BBB247|nr:ClbS/DfsB family four-helix bundle protein [Gulbenkiania mobilis]